MVARLLASWRAFVTPLALGGVSVLAALALWVAVTEAQNPSREAFFDGAIEVKAVNIPEGQAVASIKEPSVSFRVSAPENTLRKLTTADFAADVNLPAVDQAISE